MTSENQKNNVEKREYPRLPTVFPIGFQIMDKDRRGQLSEMKEGFTRNIGKGGMGIFAKTLKGHDKEMTEIVPRETKLRLIINVPLDVEPVESFATVEWVEKKCGHIVDTYVFGVSYDTIDEIERAKIMEYASWLRLKPRLITITMAVLSILLAISVAGLLRTNAMRIAKEEELVVYRAKNKQQAAEKAEAEKNRASAESTLIEIQNKQAEIEARVKSIEQEKRVFEKRALLSEEDRDALQAELEDMTEKKSELEKNIKGNEEAVSVYPPEESSENNPDVSEAFDQRVKLEEGVYKRFKELILDGKIQPLSAYVSAHRGSIYHAAALFALAELRYKAGDMSLAEANYIQIVELYPRSKYALYASHRLDQIRRKYNYVRYSLKDLCEMYNLPELFDYRDIEPYYNAL